MLVCFCWNENNPCGQCRLQSLTTRYRCLREITTACHGIKALWLTKMNKQAKHQTTTVHNIGLQTNVFFKVMETCGGQNRDTMLPLKSLEQGSSRGSCFWAPPDRRNLPSLQPTATGDYWVWWMTWQCLVGVLAAALSPRTSPLFLLSGMLLSPE